jgi:hypothetical protein
MKRLEMPGIKFISFIILTALFIYPSVVKSPKSTFNECPIITVECPDYVGETQSPAIFSAAISDNGSKAVYTYRWTISAGTIIEGQDTPKITVNGSGLGGQSITATIEVSGLPEGCPSRASCTMAVAFVDCCRLFDVYHNISFDKEKSRLNNFAIQLNNEQGAVGHIIVYAGRRTYVGEAKTKAEGIRDYLTKELKVGREKVKIMDGGYHEELTVELWIVSAGADAPTPYPTVEPSQVQIIRNNEKARKRKGRGKL